MFVKLITEKSLQLDIHHNIYVTCLLSDLSYRVGALEISIINNCERGILHVLPPPPPPTNNLK